MKELKMQEQYGTDLSKLFISVAVESSKLQSLHYLQLCLKHRSILKVPFLSFLIFPFVFFLLWKSKIISPCFCFFFFFSLTRPLFCSDHCLWSKQIRNQILMFLHMLKTKTPLLLTHCFLSYSHFVSKWILVEWYSRMFCVFE